MKLGKILAACLTLAAASSVFAANPITIKVGDNWNNTHPMAAAVGKPDERVGELPAVYIQLKPGHSVSIDELLQHAQHCISERAAIPKDIWLIEQIPVTAVGKTFKPELRLDAMRRTLLERLGDLAETLQVKVRPDSQYGTHADIQAIQPITDWRTLAEQRLALFKLSYSLLP